MNSRNSRLTNIISFSERGNPRRYTVEMPESIGQFHQHMIHSIAGRHHTMRRIVRNNSTSVQTPEGMPRIEDFIRALVNEHSPKEISNTIPSYKAEGDLEECSICQEIIKSGETFRRLPCSDTVNHYFHLNCIDPWLETNSTCPNCRSNILNN